MHPLLPPRIRHLCLVQGLANNGTKAAALGLEASVDMDNMCSKNADGNWTYQHIEEAVADGQYRVQSTVKSAECRVQCNTVQCRAVQCSALQCTGDQAPHR